MTSLILIPLMVPQSLVLLPLRRLHCNIVWAERKEVNYFTVHEIEYSYFCIRAMNSAVGLLIHIDFVLSRVRHFIRFFVLLAPPIAFPLWARPCEMRKFTSNLYPLRFLGAHTQQTWRAFLYIPYLFFVRRPIVRPSVRVCLLPVLCRFLCVCRAFVQFSSVPSRHGQLTFHSIHFFMHGTAWHTARHCTVMQWRCGPDQACTLHNC